MPARFRNTLQPEAKICLFAKAMIDFEQFWKLYPRRVAKLEAQKAWKRMPEELQRMAIEGIERMNAACAWPIEMAHVPHASTWLRGHRWQDEIDDVAPPTRKDWEERQAQRELRVGQGPQLLNLNRQIAEVAKRKAMP